MPKRECRILNDNTCNQGEMCDIYYNKHVCEHKINDIYYNSKVSAGTTNGLSSVSIMRSTIVQLNMY